MSAPQPFFSLVIPSYARPERLSSGLEAVARLDYPHDRLEVIVVDDGSPEPVGHLVERFRDRMPLTVIRQPHAGPATARNTGAGAACGEFVAFTDDDCAPTPSGSNVSPPNSLPRPARCSGGGRSTR